MPRDSRRRRFVKPLVRRSSKAIKRALRFGPEPMVAPIERKVTEPLEQTPANEAEIVSRLMASYRAAIDANVPSPAYQLSGGWKELLDSEWRSYRDAIARHEIEPVASFLRNFFRNEGLSGFWGNTKMFESFVARDDGRAALMRRQLKAWRDALPSAEIAELEAPRIGNPWGYQVEGTLLYEPVVEYHYQADYFASLLADIPSPTILEIGGGFGGLAYHILKRIPDARYIGLDLPENTLIQAYYLMCAFPKAKVGLFGESLEGQDVRVLPNFMLPEIRSADLIVKVRSLSEMPMETIIEYHREIDRISPLFFFHENIARPRLDGHQGVPSTEFPELKNLIRIAATESRWPRYQNRSAYPCQENLFIRRSAISRARSSP